MLCLSYFSDFSLHQHAIEEGIISELLSILKLKLNPKPTKRKQEEEVTTDTDELSQCPTHDRDEESVRRETVVVADEVGLVKPCVQCLQLLVLTSMEVRGRLASDATFLLGIFKGERVLLQN